VANQGRYELQGHGNGDESMCQGCYNFFTAVSETVVQQESQQSRGILATYWFLVIDFGKLP
jgi:hypothetical protein